MGAKNESASVKPASTGRGRISLLNVPLDIVPPDELPEIINRQLSEIYDVSTNEKKQGRNIVLLSLWDLLRARGRNEFRDYVYRACMVIPVSKSLINGARFHKKKVPVRYMPFYFFIDLLSILEGREFTVYLLGGSDKILKRVENNIHQTFPRLRIVGRCTASFSRQEEPAIVEAIRKTSPHLLLVGRGVRGGELWIARNSSRLNQGLRIWCSDLFDVFAEKRHRPPEGIFNLGLEAFIYCLANPLKFLRFFLYIWYKILLVVYRILNKY